MGLAIGMGLAGTAVAAMPSYNLVTASENGSHLRIGQDLARYVAPGAGIQLQALPSLGSVDNLKRLRDDPRTPLALVQADMYQAYRDLALKGNAEAVRLLDPMRVVMPLYHDEVYLIARADAPLRSIADIQNQRINIGPLGSGSALTATALYQTMFGQPLSVDRVTTWSNEEALIKLVRDKSIDVVVVVAAQPAPLFVGMEPGVEKYFKLLELGDSPAATAALAHYARGVVRATSYPRWLTQDQPVLSIQNLLVTYDRNQPDTQAALVRLAESMCQNFTRLQRLGHPKWGEVRLNLPALQSGWRYYPHTAPALRRCRPNDPAATPAPTSGPGRAASQCPLQDEVLGLCRS